MISQSSSRRTPRPLYEYRGNHPEVAPAKPVINIAPLGGRPVCPSCAGPVEKVLAGWWCDSCQTASA